MKQIKIGFIKSDKKTWNFACSSVTLIQDGKNIILVDTGGKGFFEEIKKKLKAEGVSPKEVNYVINTHSHPDHNWNNAFFENAKFVSSGGILIDKFYWKKLPIQVSKNIKVVSTRGHSDDSCSVIVKSGRKVYAVVGDLFHKDRDKIPSFEKNTKEIRENRKKILEMADYIIPGHGEMFEVVK